MFEISGPGEFFARQNFEIGSRESWEWVGPARPEGILRPSHPTRPEKILPESYIIIYFQAFLNITKLIMAVYS